MDITQQKHLTNVRKVSIRLPTPSDLDLFFVSSLSYLCSCCPNANCLFIFVCLFVFRPAHEFLILWGRNHCRIFVSNSYTRIPPLADQVGVFLPPIGLYELSPFLYFIE